MSQAYFLVRGKDLADFSFRLRTSVASGTYLLCSETYNGVIPAGGRCIGWCLRFAQAGSVFVQRNILGSLQTSPLRYTSLSARHGKSS